MNVLDLFSGIGGFSLGLERAGMRTIAFCEIDPYCQQVLRKHWPDVPICGDIRKENWEWARYSRSVDVICGGFPCQDVSIAGDRRGLAGDRSGLWSEFARIIGEVRPKYCIVENTPGLLSLGMDRVIGDLAGLGYDSEWESISAASLGARHIRQRIWIVAYPHSQGLSQRQVFNGFSRIAGKPSEGETTAMGSWWAIEPDLVRVVHGVSRRVDRIKALGNAIVPQLAEVIGRAIMEFECGKTSQG